MRDFFSAIGRTRDWQSLVLLTAILVIVSWVLLLPFSRTVQQAFLQRFQLATPSYAVWAVQQPVPSMYNFENRYWISERRLSAEDWEQGVAHGKADGLLTGMLNHFPARAFTFGDGRINYLDKKEKPQWLYLQTQYRGQAVSTVWLATPDSTGGFRFERQRQSLFNRSTFDEANQVRRNSD